MASNDRKKTRILNRKNNKISGTTTRNVQKIYNMQSGIQNLDKSSEKRGKSKKKFIGEKMVRGTTGTSKKSPTSKRELR